MNRREFCGAAPLLLAGCGSGEAGMAEYPLQPSPTRTAHNQHSSVPGYATGLWTPALTFAVPGDLTITYNSQAGSWTRIGNLVICTFNLLTAVFTHTTASGNALISGFPIDPTVLVSNGESISTLRFGGITKANYTQFCLSLGHNTSPVLAVILASGQGQSSSTVTAANMPTAGVVLLDGVLIYPVQI